METVNQEVIETTQETNEEPSKEPRMFTQEELDLIVKERLGRERSKYADYEDMKEKAAKFDEISEASKTELQKATERADKLQAELDRLTKAEEVRGIREEVAKVTGVPVHLLTAETKEDCEAQANAIMSFAKPDGKYPSVRDGGEVIRTSSGTTEEQFEEWFNSQL